MELTTKDLLNAIKVKPFGDFKDIEVEIVNEDGTYTIIYGKGSAIEAHGEKLVNACDIKGHTISIYVKK